MCIFNNLRETYKDKPYVNNTSCNVLSILSCIYRIRSWFCRYFDHVKDCNNPSFCLMCSYMVIIMFYSWDSTNAMRLGMESVYFGCYLFYYDLLDNFVDRLYLENVSSQSLQDSIARQCFNNV